MAKIVGENSEEKRLNVVVPKELGEIPKNSLESSEFLFGFVDNNGQRIKSFTIRELNGEDEEVLEGEDNIAEKMMSVAKRVVIKIGSIEDRKIIEEIILKQLCFIDLLKIIYMTRYVTLGKVFKYKAICTNIYNDDKGSMGICGNITTQMGDLSSVVFYRTKEGDIIDEYEVDLGGTKYGLRRMNGHRQLQMSRDYGVKAQGLKTAMVGARLFKINDKEVDGVKEAKKMNLKYVNKLHKFIADEMDEGACDDIFFHDCPKCKAKVETEIELDSDFFSLAE